MCRNFNHNPDGVCYEITENYKNGIFRAPGSSRGFLSFMFSLFC